MKLNLTGFQSCDVRGVYGMAPDAELSPLHAYLIGLALARQTPPDKRILISGDGRASTPPLLAALAQGLGRDCINLGPKIPTPLGYLARQLDQAHTTAIVTASHNPPPFNGVKIQIGDWPVTPEEIAGIRDHVQALWASGVRFPDSPASAVTPFASLSSAWDTYRAAARRAFNPHQSTAIAVDCMHGCYSGYARELLAEMGYAATAIRDECLGDFDGITPDPSVDRNLAPLQALIRSGTFRFGAALDGDGDRVRILDERAAPLDNGALLVLMTRYLIESGRNGGRTKVIYDQKTRLAVVHALQQVGAIPVMERSGHTFIRTRVLQEDALVAGEASGHFFWGRDILYPVPAGDCGLFMIPAMDAILQYYGQPLSRLAATIPDSPYYTGDIRGLLYAGDRRQLLAHLAARIDPRDGRVVTRDGLRIENPSAFVQLRASVTESHTLTASLDAATWRDLQAMADRLIRLLPADAAGIGQAIRSRVETLECHGNTERGRAQSDPSRPVFQRHP